MERYSLTTEVTKDGRSKLVQYCVYDNNEDRVIARYADEKDAAAVISKWELSQEVKE